MGLLELLGWITGNPKRKAKSKAKGRAKYELKKELLSDQTSKGESEEYEARKSLEKLPQVGTKTAHNLYKAGYTSAAEVVQAPKSEVEQVQGIGPKKAEKITSLLSVQGNSQSSPGHIASSNNYAQSKEIYEDWKWERSGEYPFEHFTDATDRVKELKRKKKHDEVENLLLWCIDYVEADAQVNPIARIPPWYYEHLAIVYRKEERRDDEVAILERYMEAVEDIGGDPKPKLESRLHKARERC